MTACGKLGVKGFGGVSRLSTKLSTRQPFSSNGCQAALAAGRCRPERPYLALCPWLGLLKRKDVRLSGGALLPMQRCLASAQPTTPSLYRKYRLKRGMLRRSATLLLCRTLMRWQPAVAVPNGCHDLCSCLWLEQFQALMQRHCSNGMSHTWVTMMVWRGKSIVRFEMRKEWRRRTGEGSDGA
eukprot:266801-Chlamydomonas_euryale.AAC.4